MTGCFSLNIITDINFYLNCINASEIISNQRTQTIFAQKMTFSTLVDEIVLPKCSILS